MIKRCLPFCLAVFCLFYFAVPALSQPLLPDLAGNTQKGYNIISWTSQYDVFKSVAVQRSADSVFNYTTIGYVKGVKKGVQAYIDGHPLPGKNWYRLYILFNSDLTWYSNRFMIYIDSAQLLSQPVLPPNDSLQQYVASMISRAALEINTAPANPSGRTDNRNNGAATPGKAPVNSTATNTVQPRTAGNTGTAAATNPRLVQPAPANNNTGADPNTTQAAPEPPPPPKLVLTLPDTDPNGVDAYAYVKSQFVFTNPFTGHVNVEIRDAKQYHYSLWFFDARDVKVLEIPAITQPAIIIDKRNFSHKGMYRFELIRDREKLESGFITIY